MEFPRKVDLTVEEWKFEISVISDAHIVASNQVFTQQSNEYSTFTTPVAIPIAALVLANHRRQHVNNHVAQQKSNFFKMVGQTVNEL